MAASSSSRANKWRVAEENEDKKLVRYKIRLGKDSSKKVYLGFDEVKGVEIAWSKIKLGSDTKESGKYAEAELLKSLDHENITKCYDYWIDDRKKVVNMITEYCSSGTLEDYIKKHKLVGNTVLIKNWCRQILSALHYLHTRDPPVIHRDIKCDNIFVNGNTGVIKLGDLGCAIIRYESSSDSEKIPRLPTYSNNDIYLLGIYCVAEMANAKLLYSNKFNWLVNPRMRNNRSSKESFAAFVLSGVEDTETKEFMERCMCKDSTRRPTALDLLNVDQFLAVDVTETSTASTSSAAGNQTLREKVQDQVAGLLLQPTEVLKQFDSRDKKFRLQGIMSEDVSISITLRMIRNDMVRTIHFEFLLGVDTIPDIMENIAVEFNLSAEVALVYENVKQLITEVQQDRKSKDNRKRGIKKLSSWFAATKSKLKSIL